jgi:RimJ/RimL family protein N-acetyltransferase
MIPLHCDPHFTFRFADDRVIPRFHLEGVQAGVPVDVFRIDPATGGRLDLLTTGVVGNGGWVDLPEQILVRAGEAFVAVPGRWWPEDDGRTTTDRVSLRPVEAGDLSRMYDLQRDPDSNRMAVTIPRTREAFDSLWAKSLNDPNAPARAILFDGTFVGHVSCFPADGEDHVGYWIDRTYWGRGIASRALSLLLRDVTKRPLTATVANSNGASLRVLQKCGFVVASVRHAPATNRYPACEVAVLVLRTLPTES